ncbi:MAG: hypothetical protein A2452_01625 [Candidatus Firestonebacteria bacterium RIFOXYC2_FULL_39_67]|nr:MAG: hypothetical protein A2536_00720 [Candidatus Firestonebacteria bacterium RIFOXYD2_FULL_39_29]OGF52356.1 MAG: hypothetical protein A2497_05875 [Candidatus Firestonebacteria bacterium RifOxyC12_full_39_7]OGF53649.1 MAG: hypothetical protein A2452_01625 [Candidatus Firestonebacteria bacterium RIFOXYC2_FULL_39_67]
MTESKTKIGDFCVAAREEIKKVIVGQDKIIDPLLVALVCGGHVLLEGVPGTAKTLLVKALSMASDCDFKRIQFTPDLMPSDVLGTSIYDENSKCFTLKKGPIFTNFLLADEINRTPPKTQSALLEAMEEHQVTIDGVRHGFDEPFIVFATSNPIEYEGTYPLPEAQLDRFLFKITIGYPAENMEKDILKKHHAGFNPRELNLSGIKKVIDRTLFKDLHTELNKIKVEESLFEYIVKILEKTRMHSDLALGASPRAGVMLLSASKGFAALRGSAFLTPDDIKFASRFVLGHRIMIKPDAEVEGINTETVLSDILCSVEVPR